MINVKTDSRKVKQGDIFIALRGVEGDGHNFINKAIENGASKIVAEYGNYEVETIIVDDTREYLNKYLYDNYHNIIDDMTIIGLTGTNGKTTTAFLTYQALNKLDYKCAYIGTIGYYLDDKVCSLNNTNPDICDLYELICNAYDLGFKYVVLEASSQGIAYGRIATLSFDYAVFTNLTQDHLDYHKTMENYALAKQQLFKQLKNNGLGIINIDDNYCNYYKIGNYITYGFNDSDYKVTNYNMSSIGTTFTINNKYEINTKLLGKYNIYNTLVTYILLDKIGIKYEDIKRVMNSINPPNGRMDIIHYNKNTIIIDYAHTEDAIKNLFNTIDELDYNNLYVVFGCTGDRDRTKRPIMTSLVLNKANYSYITSDDLHNEEFNHIVSDMLDGINKDNYIVIEDRYEACKKAIKRLKENDLLLILGKGHEEFIIVKDKKIPYNDRKAVNSIIINMETVSN